MHPTTPDGRYFVVKGQLWRCSNPSLSDEVRQNLVSALMQARRAVKEAKAVDDAQRLRSARAKVDAAKVALGKEALFGGVTAARTTTERRQSLRLTLTGTPPWGMLTDTPFELASPRRGYVLL
jgi:hypothetical protein